MGFLGDTINAVNNVGQDLVSGAKGLIDDVSTFCSGLVDSVGAGVSSMFEGDVIGLNANQIPQMKQAIEEYITTVQTHLDDIKANTSTDTSMKGEYADAVKQYVSTACEVCYKITTQLRYFEDQLTAVQNAYTKKDENLASTITDTAAEMDSKWTEYKVQS